MSLKFTPTIETDAFPTLAYDFQEDATPPDPAYARIAIIRVQDVVGNTASAAIRHGDWEQEFTFLLE